MKDFTRYAQVRYFILLPVFRRALVELLSQCLDLFRRLWRSCKTLVRIFALIGIAESVETFYLLI